MNPHSFAPWYKAQSPC